MRFQIRNGFILVAAFVITPITWMVLFSDGDLGENSLLEQRLAELRDRLHYAESLNQERENDVHILRQQVQRLLRRRDQDTNGSSLVSPVIPEEAVDLLADWSQDGGGADISPPGMYNYLPHVIGKPAALVPSFKMSRGRVGVSIVLGVPTIKRDRETYLIQSLESFINNLSPAEKEDCLIIVFVAEPNDLAYVKSVGKDIETRFKPHVDSGLLEVISPSSLFYPSFDGLRETFGDPLERVKWRTKQNLDFSYLMMYARAKGTYYVQVEDDVITRPDYLTTMKTFAIQQQVDDWILLEFSKLGFIGKLFKSQDLPLVVEFFLMFHKDKPIDWLLDHLLYVKVCNPEKDRKHCQHSINEMRRRFKPSLFQHIGMHSSLPGKIQKLKDKDFGKNVHVQNHLNPNAEVTTTLKVYQHFSLDRAYMGETFFWGLIPQAGDTVSIQFNPPVVIEKYLLRSGNPEHPGDKFYNTTVEVLPAEHVAKTGGILSNERHEHDETRTDDGYLIVNKFEADTGMAAGSLAEELGPIHTLRLRVLSTSQSWVILSEIMITPKKS